MVENKKEKRIYKEKPEGCSNQGEGQLMTNQRIVILSTIFHIQIYLKGLYSRVTVLLYDKVMIFFLQT